MRQFRNAWPGYGISVWIGSNRRSNADTHTGIQPLVVCRAELVDVCCYTLKRNLDGAFSCLGETKKSPYLLG
jgi:hypothetical protein